MIPDSSMLRLLPGPRSAPPFLPSYLAHPDQQKKQANRILNMWQHFSSLMSVWETIWPQRLPLIFGSTHPHQPGHLGLCWALISTFRRTSFCQCFISIWKTGVRSQKNLSNVYVCNVCVCIYIIIHPTLLRLKPSYTPARRAAPWPSCSSGACHISTMEAFSVE